MISNSAVDTLLFSDDQAILSNSESGLQMSVHSLSRICKDFGFQISTLKTKVMAHHIDNGACSLSHTTKNYF